MAWATSQESSAPIQWHYYKSAYLLFLFKWPLTLVLFGHYLILCARDMDLEGWLYFNDDRRTAKRPSGHEQL